MVAVRATTAFDTDSPLSALVDRLADAASVDTVYGDPMERDDRTVVPVARVGWGFGGGGGSGPADAGEATAEDGSGDAGAEPAGGEGSGMGGGVSAKPVCALEITDGGTRFVRVGSRKGLLAVGALAFLAGVVLGRR